MDRNCEILFEYLRSILYDAKPGTLDIDELDEPFKKLGMGLQCLDESVREMKAYSADLPIGNLKTLHENVGNRFWFADQMEKLLKRKDSFVLCFIDLDHLKYVNEKYGHLEGDEYLKRFVHVVRRRIREEDLFARVGGDEFCTVFRNCSVKTAEDKLMMILQEFSQNAGVRYPASFSYGIVEVCAKEETLTVTEILKRADAQMYEMKRIHRQMNKEKLV